jgi:hypothetical protein
VSNEIASVRPSVYIGTGYPTITYTDQTDRLYCVDVVDSFGLSPSTATLRYIPADESVPSLTNALTLDGGGTLKADQRVIVVDESASQIYYHGWIKRRQDQGAPAISLWGCEDDRSILKNIFMRGCIIKDVDGELRFSSTIPTIFNYNGAWNCIGHVIGDKTYPVFSHTANFGAAYESPNEAFPDSLYTDSVSPWTPRRALEYIRLVLHYKEILGLDRLDGMTGEVENSLVSDILGIPATAASGMVGIDSSFSAIDPLDKKLPQVQVQGDSILGALGKILAIAGTHDLDISYDTTSLTAGKSIIRYRPIGLSAVGTGTDLKMQTRGKVDVQYGDVYDFSLSEDYSNTTYSVIVEGQPVKVETELAYNRDSTSTATIEPAWLATEEAGFLKCIYGSTTLSGTAGTYALAPAIHGDPTGSFERCNGTGTLPLIYAGSPQAVAVARQNFPTVFRAWRVVARGQLAEALAEPTGANGFIKAARPILPEQLQFFTWLSSTLGDDRLRANLPIRIQVAYDTGKYVDIPRDISIRVSADKQGSNLIWLDGMAEGADALIYCIYDGSVYSLEDIKASKVKTRSMKINCAVPTDYRVRGVDTYSDPNRDTAFQSAFYGVQQVVYLDEPESYQEHLQYKSKPAIVNKFFGGPAGATGVGDATGITRALPPGSEQVHATYAAQRELSRRKHPVRKSSWMRAGIHNDVKAGDWLDRIYITAITSTATTVSEYDIDSSVRKVTFDFLEQKTIVGDVYGEIMA